MSCDNTYPSNVTGTDAHHGRWLCPGHTWASVAVGLSLAITLSVQGCLSPTGGAGGDVVSDATPDLGPDGSDLADLGRGDASTQDSGALDAGLGPDVEPDDAGVADSGLVDLGADLGQGDLGGDDLGGEADAGPRDLGAEDAGVTPDGGDDGGEVQTCPDRFEPDDVPAQAARLGPGLHTGLGICPAGDEDFYVIPVAEGESFTVAALFSHQDGDIDMVLENPRTGRRIRAESGDDDEVIEGTAAQDGDYLLHVYGYRGATNVYDLVIHLSMHCPEDPMEPNDRREDAAAVGPGEIAGVVCPGDEDWFQVVVEQDRILSTTLEFDPREGALRLELWGEGRGGAMGKLADGAGQEGRRLIEAGPLSAGPYWIKVLARDDAQVSYRLRISMVSPDQGRRVRVHGSVTRDDRPVFPTGYGIGRARAVSHAQVELVRASDDQVLAHGWTDDQGRYDLEGVNRGPAGVYVRVSALWEVPGGPSAQVLDRHGRGRIHTWRSPEELDDSEGLDERLLVHVPISHGPAGAFNILEQAIAALTLAREVIMDHGPWPTLSFRWEPGRPFMCGSCYSEDEIDVGGGVDDPDEFDDFVIIHEIGHFLADNWSEDDSSGGPHDGSRDDPRLAWSEGWATFFACSVLDDPLYLDYRPTGVSQLDLDLAAGDESFGTSNGRPDGLVSENLVSALLWDAFDQEEPDDDPLGLGLDAMTPVFGYLASRGRGDRGARGVDLYDYLDGCLCEGLAEPEDLVNLTEARRYPYDPEGLPCEKPRAPVQTRLLGERELWLKPLVDVPSVRVVVSGAKPLVLGPLAKDQETIVALPEGEPVQGRVLVGVILDFGPGLRLHAPVVDPEVRHFEPDPGLASGRTLCDHRGKALIQWAPSADWTTK